MSLPNGFTSLIENETGIHNVNDIKKADDLLKLCDKSLGVIDRILSYGIAYNQIVKSFEKSHAQINLSIERSIEQQTACYSRMTALSNKQTEIEKNLDFGKEVCALPCNVTGDDLTNAAIKSGAESILCPKDLIDAIESVCDAVS